MIINNEKHYDLIKFEDGDFSLDVKVSPNEDTVWLTANQIAILFSRDEKTIRKHINNVFLENEVDKYSNTQKMRVAGVDQMVKFYSLNVIISVGYRVKSKRGVIFRQWANTILKEYLLKGSVINEERCLSCTSNILDLQSKYKEIENKVKDIRDIVYQDNNKLIYEGDIIEPIKFLKRLFHLAKTDITITDYYADSFLLTLLDDINVNITIITSTNSYLNKEKIKENIRIIKNDNIHGRYIFIDNTSYVIDNSFNAIGKKRFVIVKLFDITKEMILKGII